MTVDDLVALRLYADYSHPLAGQGRVELDRDDCQRILDALHKAHLQIVPFPPTQKAVFLADVLSLDDEGGVP